MQDAPNMKPGLYILAMLSLFQSVFVVVLGYFVQLFQRISSFVYLVFLLSLTQRFWYFSVFTADSVCIVWCKAGCYFFLNLGQVNKTIVVIIDGSLAI